LRRWVILEETVNTYRTYEKTVTNLVGSTTVRIADLDAADPISAKHYVFPLPGTEIDLANGNLIQNDGF